jgi:hypothetical protein
LPRSGRGACDEPIEFIKLWVAERDIVHSRRIGDSAARVFARTPERGLSCAACREHKSVRWSSSVP